MLLRTTTKFFIRMKNTAKYCVSTSCNTFDLNSSLTSKEQSKILNFLNESSKAQLSRFNLPQSRIKTIENWRNERGPFTSLKEVLELEGLGPHFLKKMCKIVIENSGEPKMYSNGSMNKRLKQLLTPSIPNSIMNSLNSAVGIYLCPMGISWAKIMREDNYLMNWNFQDFNSLPKKMLSSDIFNLAVSTIRKLPCGDVYIFETMPSVSLTNKTQEAAVTHIEQLELTSMLTALLNTSINHNISLQDIDEEDNRLQEITNRVFYLKSKVPARLFKTLMGNEKVSAITKVTDLLDGKVDSDVQCTPVTVDNDMKVVFRTQSSANKELLGQSLLLAVSFMDLCVYKTPESLAAISSYRRTRG